MVQLVQLGGVSDFKKWWNWWFYSTGRTLLAATRKPKGYPVTVRRVSASATAQVTVQRLSFALGPL
ncbi:hypothetical protein B0T16DRAFT_396697 [Cercophora newfieldiana]|uniref:Uncharacterized protein n=1 Tax=Cercophora newfieldiana TaxID=92897 RepID=A0AA39YNX4_9PEZI|nr:hypothetical protein B0T16DRAFT_396697 [Cercophora newfieldiana]